MAAAEDGPNEHTALLVANGGRRGSRWLRRDDEASSIIRSHVTLEEQKMAESSVGERLPYNDYTTIDWLHDLVRLLIRLVGGLPSLILCFPCRSKTHIASALSTMPAVYAIDYWASSTRLQDGSPQR